jgi:CBS domain-containing protein
MADAPENELLRPYRVGEVMSTSVRTATPDESLLSATRTMRTHHVSGLPVVDAKGDVVGVISERDIVGALDRQVGVGHARGILDLLLAAYEPKRRDVLTRSVAGLLNGRVGDVMSHPPVTVEADTPLRDVWHLLRKHSINRVPVVQGTRLIGIVTRQDLLEIVQAVPAAGPKPARVPPAKLPSP